MIYEIVTATKSDVPTEEALRAALAEHKAGFVVENIDSNDETWTVRLAEKTADGKPPWLDKEKSDDSSDSDSADDSSSDSDSSDSDSDDDGDSDSDSKGDDDGDKSKGKKDPAAEVKSVIDELTSLFTDLGGKVQDLQAAHDEKAQKLKDINDTVGEDAGGPGEHSGPPAGDLADIGPTPGAPPAGPPKAPLPSPGMDGRKKPVPGVPGGGLPTFTNFQVATHPGVDDSGNKISLTAAAVAMENDPEFSEYEVVGMTENADGTFSAKLKLRDKE